MTARVVFRPDVNGAHLSAVLAAGQIRAGRQMRAIESQSRRPRREGNTAHAMCRNERCSLLGGSVNVNRQRLSMPVQLLRRIGIVVDIDDDLFALLEAQQGSRKLPVINGGGDDVVRCQFHEPVADPDRVTRRTLRRC
jgi:hypothetical protein